MLRILQVETCHLVGLSVPLIPNGDSVFFMVLMKKEYGISEAYDATKVEALKAIVTILEKVKAYIHQ